MASKPDPQGKGNELLAANTFAADQHGKFLHDTKRKCWMRYDQGVWLLDEDPRAWIAAENAVIKTYRSLENPYKYHKASVVNAALRGASAHMAVTPASFDANPNTAGLPDGKAINLATGEIRDARPSDMLTKRLGVAPQEGEPKAWLAFLRESFADHSDAEAVIGFLRRFFRDALFGRACKHDFFLFLQGLAGTGKTTLVSTMLRVFGDYAAVFAGERFAKDNNAHRQWLIPLIGCRLAVVDELPENNAVWNSEVLNNIPAGGKITANRMHTNDITFVSQAHLVIASNTRPASTNPGVFRRCRLVAMNRKPANPDPELREETLPAEAGRILGWLLRGDGRITATPPGSVAQDSAEYQTEADTLLGWLESRCVKHPNARSAIKDLHEDFAGETGSRMTVRSFGIRLSSMGYPASKDKRSRLGIALGPAE